MNPNPSKARQALKQKMKPPSVQDAALIVWEALQAARGILDHPTAEMKLKACHAVFQGSQAYAKLYEVGELEARLTALEKGGTDGETITVQAKTSEPLDSEFN